MRNLLRYIFTLLLLLLVACHEGGTIVDDEQISVMLKLSTAEATRGNVTDYPSDTSSWSQGERAVDGRYLYSLSVYIVDSEKNIVARKENIVVDSQVTEVTVGFDKSYNLKRGVYTLMAVANNVDHTIGNTTYESGLVNNWKADSYDDLMSNKIAANNHFVSPKDIIQPLSLVKDFEIHAGSNFVEGELVRTVARLRIEVKNNSGSLPLKINNLTFSNNFAQQGAYVFDDGSDRKYFTPTGAIVATSDKALLPFAFDSGVRYKSIAQQTSSVVYDGYQLESKAAANGEFTYTLDMSYDGATLASDVFKRESNTAVDITQITNGYYLIYNTSRQRYLSVDEHTLVAASISNDEFNSIAARNVWQIIKSGNNYYIKNVESGEYIQVPTNDSVATGTSEVLYTLSDNDSSIRMNSGNKNYIGVDNSYKVKRYDKTNNNPVNFNFYKVTKSTVTSTEDINRQISIPLTSIDPVSQQSSKVTAIKRNDFINVLVTVSYNPTSGEFDFVVEDWKTGGGQVEFN